MASRRRVFHAVFPTHSEAEIPTPQATPVLGSGSFDAPPGHQETPSQEVEDVALERIKWERAWHNATAFLALPERTVGLDDASTKGFWAQYGWARSVNNETTRGISYVLSNAARGKVIGGKGKRTLLEWYGQEMTRHYVDRELPLLTKALDQNPSAGLMMQLLKFLERLQSFYFHPLQEQILSIAPDAQREVNSIKANHHAIVSTSLYKVGFSKHLAQFSKERGSLALAAAVAGNEDAMAIDSEEDAVDVREQLRIVFTLANKVGLGGSKAQELFAEVMNDLLVSHVVEDYAGEVTNPEKTPETLDEWTIHCWSPVVTEVIECLTSEEEGLQRETILQNELRNWRDRAAQELGSLRLREAFDIVVDWQNTHERGLSDLTTFSKGTACRALLTSRFSWAVSHRLLQPGASTIEILQVYIHIIMAFVKIDTKGVLLDRVSHPIRRYLRGREDTVRIIIQGLLIDPNDTSKASDQLLELAKVLSDFREQYNEDEDIDKELFTVDWTPDPVDAGPDYQRYGPSEIIGSLIGIFESKDVFVKEFQTMLSESLLKGEYDFSSEVQVLELFKKRFGEAPLQACEVMLKDLSDSRRTDDYIKKQPEWTDSKPDITAKILSRLYWPPLHSESFSVPAEVSRLQQKYAARFEQYKPSRKLTWLQALGRVHVELQLDDRTLEEDVQTWQASVIYAFQSDLEGDSLVEKTLEQLSEELAMDEDMVQAALTFWVGKLVLHKEASGAYSVLERLPSTSGDKGLSTGTSMAAAAAAASASAAAAEVGTSAVRSQEDITEEKMAVFWMYIVNMLTNQGSMPLQRIVMMLKFVVPGGFTYGNDELRAFLAKRIEEGKLEMAGSNYKIVKGA